MLNHLINITGSRTHNSWGWLAARVAVGFILLWKGTNFIRDTFLLEQLFGETSQTLFTANEAVLAALAVLLMLIGGILIILGVFTRIVSLVQLVIFSLGSLFIHAGYIERGGFELVLTVTVPFVLLIFAATWCSAKNIRK